MLQFSAATAHVPALGAIVTAILANHGMRAAFRTLFAGHHCAWHLLGQFFSASCTGVHKFFWLE
jgi:hypothetical protein